MVQQCGNAMHVNAIGSVVAAVLMLLPNLGARTARADPPGDPADPQGPKRLLSSLGYLLHSARVKHGRLA
jgi:hypothetical protein